ncbi:ATP-binding protein [Leptospira kanakyensis]|uniref:ATP-binding protein n=1 Tax=Leptospira kanakyensis TaxID=2484968 RepID=UPI00223D8349|nr:ATP-binding protein [Leptospira kanakyensis]MCW7470572.1 ATP-binding protein [Leptospira kanakyensis]
MTKVYRLSLLGLSIILLVGLGYYIKRDFSFLLNDFWFTSGLLLLILLSLLDQPHFSKDSNVFINAVTASISLLLIEPSNRDYIFWSFFIFLIYLTISSYILMWQRNNPLKEENVHIQLFTRLNRHLGRPEAIFSSFFLWGGIRQFGLESKEMNLLLWYWILFMVFNVPALAKTIEGYFLLVSETKDKEAIGQIFGVQSKNTFLVKLIESRTSTTRIFDFVEFKYSIDNSVKKGLILDVYLLNQEQWVKILTTNEIEKIFSYKDVFLSHTPDLVYKISSIPKNDYLDRFIGLVTENSTIEKIKFIYNSKASIFEGQLLELNIGEKRILYQVIQGTTKIELLENKNQTGLIVADAFQLGTWNEKTLRFEQYGWVPSINTPIYLATNINDVPLSKSEYVIGNIPGTNYPVIVNKDIAITHHTAILGVTGSGKSVFVRNLILQIVNDSTKVIIIDLTGEYKEKIKNILPVISDEKGKLVFEALEKIASVEKKYPREKNPEIIKAQEEIIKAEFYASIKSFLEGELTEAIFELPDISNNSEIIEYTKWFFWVLFKTAKTKNSFGKRVCVVLEEAHTIVPELNSMGVSDFASKATVNSISQIALQGRKYNIGFFVIAQRTANVSKTVLTQCNSIIVFQEFDKTSGDFLSNYLGSEYIKALPTLKFRQAIAVGKAFKSNVPMIFEVPKLET